MRLPVCMLMALTLTLAGCAGGGDKRHDRPDWVDGPSEDYPRAAYLTGVGVADDANTARDRARSDLAKTFRVAIDETATDTRSHSVSETSTASASEYSAEIRRDLTTRTRQVLEGVTVPETWTDATGRVHALAVLNRSAAAMRLRQQVSELDNAAESMLSRARATDDAFMKARHAIDVVENQRRRAAVQAMLQAVDATGRGTPPRWSLARLEADMATALGRVELRAAGNGDWKPMIAGTLAEAGFTVVENGPYTASFSVDVVEMPQREGWHWRRAVAVLDVTGPDERSLGQQRWEFKESATDAGTAEFRLREAVAGKLGQEARNAVLDIIAQ